MSDQQEQPGPVERIVLYRLTSIETTMRDLADKVGRLILIEERQTQITEQLARVFGALKDQDARLRTLELAQPITNRTNVWVERVLICAAGAVGAVLLKLALT